MFSYPNTLYNRDAQTLTALCQAPPVNVRAFRLCRLERRPGSSVTAFRTELHPGSTPLWRWRM